MSFAEAFYIDPDALWDTALFLAETNGGGGGSTTSDSDPVPTTEPEPTTTIEPAPTEDDGTGDGTLLEDWIQAESDRLGGEAGAQELASCYDELVAGELSPECSDALCFDCEGDGGGFPATTSTGPLAFLGDYWWALALGFGVIVLNKGG